MATGFLSTLRRVRSSIVRGTMRARRIILQVHLYLGLAAGIFLAILGLTGSIMAFEGDIDHWLNPDRWYVTRGPRMLPEDTLVSTVDRRFFPSRVLVVQFNRASNIAQAMQLSDGRVVYMNPYAGTAQGVKEGPSASDRFIGYVHRIHQMLVPDPQSSPDLAKVGKIAVSSAGLLLCLLVPTGWILWWRGKRASVNWKASLSRIFYDAHRVMGIYASLFLLIAAFTGVMIGFDFGEKTYYRITRSSPVMHKPLPLSTPVPQGTPITSDEAMAIARRALPDASVAMLFIPAVPTGSYTAMMRVPEETSEAVHSSVTIDQFSGQVLYVRNFLTESPGYRLIRFNRSLHTGDVFGLPTHILMSLSSLLLVGMVITGAVIWWKKLAA
jgi:uncharacterized iron-regulated membrane protein